MGGAELTGWVWDEQGVRLLDEPCATMGRGCGGPVHKAAVSEPSISQTKHTSSPPQTALTSAPRSNQPTPPNRPAGTTSPMSITHSTPTSAATTWRCPASPPSSRRRVHNKRKLRWSAERSPALAWQHGGAAGRRRPLLLTMPTSHAALCPVDLIALPPITAVHFCPQAGERGGAAARRAVDGLSGAMPRLLRSRVHLPPKLAVLVCAFSVHTLLPPPAAPGHSRMPSCC